MGSRILEDSLRTDYPESMASDRGRPISFSMPQPWNQPGQELKESRDTGKSGGSAV
jgi:hypothetical protein